MFSGGDPTNFNCSDLGQQHASYADCEAWNSGTTDPVAYGCEFDSDPAGCVAAKQKAVADAFTSPRAGAASPVAPAGGEGSAGWPVQDVFQLRFNAGFPTGLRLHSSFETSVEPGGRTKISGQLEGDLRLSFSVHRSEKFALHLEGAAQFGAFVTKMPRDEGDKVGGIRPDDILYAGFSLGAAAPIALPGSWRLRPSVHGGMHFIGLNRPLLDLPPASNGARLHPLYNGFVDVGVEAEYNGFSFGAHYRHYFDPGFDGSHTFLRRSGGRERIYLEGGVMLFTIGWAPIRTFKK